MTTVNVSRSLLRKVIAHVADNVHAFRQSESLPDGTLPNDEVRDIVESEERMVEELRQALAPEQPSEGDVGSDYPLGAIVNGAAFAERLEAFYPDMAKDEEWREFRKCFAHLAGYVEATTPPQEPVAYAIISDDGFVRLFRTEAEATHQPVDSGDSIAPLYLAPVNDHSTCHRDGCSLANVPLRLASCACAAPANDEAVRLLEVARDAIGMHNAPRDCYSTGPLYGDARDTVCPACRFIAQHDAFLATQQEEKG